MGRNFHDADRPVIRVRIDADTPDPEPVRRAAQLLREGGLVAFPTETVYGLGAHALDTAAVGRIFAAKRRPASNPLIVHLADAPAARRLAGRWRESAVILSERFWPGPLTLIVPGTPRVPPEVTAGLPSIALRVPAHPVARALLAEAGIPVAAPSANPYMAVSPTTADHVEDGLGDAVGMILDAGPTPVGIESTVVDLTGDRPVILRPGSITRLEIEEAVGPVASAPPAPAEAAPRASPGMAPRHYAPRARLVLLDPGDTPARDEAAGAILRSDRTLPVGHTIRLPAEPAGYARRLYAALHELDRRRCPVIYLERVPDAAEWEGVRDRLRRAAAPAGGGR